jgi:hypothetical protein
MPTTSVPRRISRLGLSWGLFDQILHQNSLGNAVKVLLTACPHRATGQRKAGFSGIGAAPQHTGVLGG